jgi:hypothetical protein
MVLGVVREAAMVRCEGWRTWWAGLGRQGEEGGCVVDDDVVVVAAAAAAVPATESAAADSATH